MKRVYMFQPEFLQGNSATVPYAAGVLAAYAKNIEQVASVYEFEDIVFMRKDINTAADNITDPSVAAFSCYIWNFEYNKALAYEIKKRYPGCTVIFGGHHIPAGSNLLEELDYVDYLIHGEGEEVFSLLLRALNGEFSVDCVPNITYRTENGIFNTENKSIESGNYPSAYLSGIFDPLIEANPDIKFNMVLETSRGCPYSCTYCDWGRMKQKIKFASLEKVFAEIDWARDKKIDMLLMADANFGMFERDVEITRYITDTHNKYGCFQALQTSYEKGNKPYVFTIARMLHSCGMNKGITLSFQSMDDTVLSNIQRKNISPSEFISALEQYNKNGISTYSELILGLPGETVQSFKNGIEKLLVCGQHTCVYIHNCELLPCSQMSDAEYMKRFGISYSFMPINHPHMDIADDTGIREYSKIVTRTSEMTENDWIEMNMFSAVIQSFHFGGILKLIAIYLHYQKNTPYTEFYTGLYEKLRSDNFKICETVRKQLENAVSGTAGLVFSEPSLCPFTLSADEFILMHLFRDIDSFYDYIRDFVLSWDDSDEYRALFDFQRAVIKRPDCGDIRCECRYDFLSYFRYVLRTLKNIPVERKDVIYTASPVCYSFRDFTKHIIWFGKKSEDKTCLSLLESNI